MNPQILSEKQKLDNLFSLMDKMVESDEMRAHWSRYLCVLVSGFIENALRIMIITHVSTRCQKHILNYVSNNIKGITNLNDEKIKQLLGSFKREWMILLENEITDEQKDAIDSVVANRHLIVHGRSVEITPVRIRDYYKRIVEILEFIDSKCLSI